MLLADIDANGWAIIIGAIVMGITQLLTTWATLFSTKRISQKNEEVRAAVTGLQEVTVVQNKKIDTVGEKILQVERQTNGMTERLVQTTKEGAHAQGQLDGYNKAKAEIASDSAVRLQLATSSVNAKQMAVTDPDIAQLHE